MMKKSVGSVEANTSMEGIARRTLAFNDEAMLCHFSMGKGARIPLHNHRASQVGYVVSGSLKFLGDSDEDTFIANAGDSYVFGPHQTHGCEVLEDSEVIEVFSPAREEYKE